MRDIKNTGKEDEMCMNYAIILAGGKGSRMKSAVPKQFMELNGKPMVCHSIDTFEHNSKLME